jgi:cellulose synthase/poly-beta-1,6-N-acetylglucosamine synthase-like glycosyltransferase
MNLTIVLAVKNRDRNIAYCMHSIHRCVPRPQRAILIDFGNAKPLFHYEKHFPWLKVIRTTRNTQRFHKARALNIGLRRVETDYVCMTDADQIFQRNFFGVLFKKLCSVKKPYVRCKTYFMNNPRILPKPKEVMQHYNYLLNYAVKYGKRPLGEGNCNAVSTEWAQSVRGYDERYIGWGYEDSSFSKRAHKAGLNMLWIELGVDTTMVHLPHERTKEYFGDSVIKKNYELFKNDNHPIVANKNITWGKP